MNEREREHLTLVARHALDLVETAIDERLKGIFTDHASKGRLHSGVTIKVSVRSMGALAEAFTKDLADKALAVARNREGFAILAAAVEQCLAICAARMPQVIQMASGRQRATSDASTVAAATKMFAGMRSNIETRIAIARYDFDSEASGAEPTTPLAVAAKKGGRPPAEFWDDMWAEIASALYEGTLIPKSQADIERAMTGWIEGSGYSASVSTVRARARRLWDRLAAGN